MTIKFQPRLRYWFWTYGLSEWNERRVTMTLFNVRIEIRFTNMKYRTRSQ